MKNKITPCKTIHYGFNKYLYNYDYNTLVADVGMNEYYIRKNSEILITYGIITCCGMIVCDPTNVMLAHLAPDVTKEDVSLLLDENNFDSKAKMYLFPGFASFVDYESIIDHVGNQLDDLCCYRYEGKYGVIYVDNDILVMGNAKEIERRFKLDIRYF